MFIYSEDEEEEKCIYTPKYGYNPLKSKTFDDHSLLGEEYYQYKPCKILFWTNIDKRITGIQTFFRNIIDSSTINSGENKGSESFNFDEFVINPNEYLKECEIWNDENSITYIYLKTNKDIIFSVGSKIGNKHEIKQSTDKKKEKIIISFFGSYDKVMNGFGLHLLDKSEYLRILFTGYFELKYKLKKEKYKEQILERMKNKKFTFQEETIIKTCLLPDVTFNAIMSFCIV